MACVSVLAFKKNKKTHLVVHSFIACSRANREHVFALTTLKYGDLLTYEKEGALRSDDFKYSGGGCSGIEPDVKSTQHNNFSNRILFSCLNHNTEIGFCKDVALNCRYLL